MRWAARLSIVLGAVACAGAALAFQRPFREYPGMEYNDFPLPSDHREQTEFVFARLMHPDSLGSFGGFRRGRQRGDWAQGYAWWTNDYPRADRHLLTALRRLTRVHARSVEQPVNLDDGDDVFDWPFLYANVNSFSLTEPQIVKLREYLMRGGFLVCDDVWGEDAWNNFMATMSRVFPGRSPEEIEDHEPVFHAVYNLEQRYQIPGEWSLRSGVPYLAGGVVPHWRALYDEKGRMSMSMWVNNDTADSWEWADSPRYPERYSALGIRIAVNHIVYALTH